MNIKETKMMVKHFLINDQNIPENSVSSITDSQVCAIADSLAFQAWNVKREATKLKIAILKRRFNQ